MAIRLPRRIVVFCLPGIGDAILFTPALASLRRAFPAAHVVIVTMFRGTADILATNPDVDEVRRFDFFHAGRWQVARYVWALRREGFDLGIMPFPANRLGYNLVNRAVGRRWRAGHRYRRQSWRNLWFLNNVVVPQIDGRHNLEENLDLVHAICRRIGVAIPSADTTLALHLTADDRRFAAGFVAAEGIAGDALLIGIHTYSSTFKNMHRKCWDKESFVRVIERLGEVHPRARAVMFSGPSDVATTDYIVRHVGARVTVVAEPNLRHALAVLQHCRLFLGNDSAVMHLAAGLGVPVVALFGPTDWRHLHPWGVPHAIVRKELPCMPCFDYSSRPLRCVAGLDYACMRDITVDEVLEAMRHLLART